LGPAQQDAGEPGQVREEAAAAGFSCVLQGCLARANDRQGRSGQLFDGGCAGFFGFTRKGIPDKGM